MECIVTVDNAITIKNKMKIKREKQGQQRYERNLNPFLKKYLLNSSYSFTVISFDNKFLNLIV